MYDGSGNSDMMARMMDTQPMIQNEKVPVYMLVQAMVVITP